MKDGHPELVPVALPSVLAYRPRPPRRPERTREPRTAIGAGRFYPAGPDTLRDMVSGLLDAVRIESGEPAAAAYLVPHASYDVAGPVAARAYARLRRDAADVARIVILAPDHDVELSGCAVSMAETWSTPLGTVRCDTVTTGMLVSDGHARADDGLHRIEHAIEVQLPFLQLAAPHARIVPIVVGSASIDDIVITLAAVAEFTAGRPDRTVVVCTSELAGTGGDTRTLQAICESAAGRIGNRDACGAYALRGLVGWAGHQGLRGRVLGRSAAPSGYVACAFDRWKENRPGPAGTVEISDTAQARTAPPSWESAVAVMPIAPHAEE